MQQLVVETPEGVVLSRDIAGAGSRSAAALVDLALISLSFFGLIFFSDAILGAGQGVMRVIAGGALLVLATYQVLFSLLGVSTPGKRLLGLEVLSESGIEANVVQHLLRGLFWPLEAALLVPVPFGMVLMASTPRHQRLGDLVAGTVVVRERKRVLPAERLAHLRWEEFEAPRLGLVPALAARFDGEDLGLLGELLGRPGIESESRARLLLQAVPHFLERLDREVPPDLSARDAHRLLMELYLFLRDTRRRVGAR